MDHLLHRLGPPDAGPAQQCSSRVSHPSMLTSSSPHSLHLLKRGRSCNLTHHAGPTQWQVLEITPHHPGPHTVAGLTTSPISAVAGLHNLITQWQPLQFYPSPRPTHQQLAANRKGAADLKQQCGGRPQGLLHQSVRHAAALHVGVGQPKSRAPGSLPHSGLREQAALPQQHGDPQSEGQPDRAADGGAPCSSPWKGFLTS